MANVFQPFGFKPFGRLDGGSPTAGMQKLTLLASDANTYMTGDVVMISSVGAVTLPASGSTIGSTGGGSIAGIFNGCEIYQPNIGRVVWSAGSPGNVGSSSPGFAYVITDPEQLFIVQASTAAVLGSTAIGQNIGFVSSSNGVNNTLTGMSVCTLASTTTASVNTLPFRIIDTYTNTAPPGVNGTSTGSEAAQIMVVQMNNQFRRNLLGTSS